MSRFLASLAIADLILVVGTATLGTLVQGDRLYAEHLIAAVLTAILTILIHAIVLTYFSATGRMMSQAIFIGRLDRAPIERIAKTKAGTIRWIAVGWLSLCIVIAFGALSARTHAWHAWHFAAAAMALMANAAAFYAHYNAVCENASLMRTVLAEYEASKAGESPHVAPALGE